MPETSSPEPSRPTHAGFWFWHAVLPILVVVAGTLLFRLTPLDVWISEQFFSPEGNRWPFGGLIPWKQLYDFGEFPVRLIFGATLLILLGGLFFPILRRWRASAAFLAIVILLGPGIMTNLVLKEHWGRPRPRQIQEFGGPYRFEPVWVYDASSSGKSFPSGHASGAFVLMALYFVALFHRWPRGVRWTLFWLGLGFGIITGMARIVQGGHFASDVLWAYAVVWLVSCACAAWILRLPDSRRDEFEP